MIVVKNYIVINTITKRMIGMARYGIDATRRDLRLDIYKPQSIEPYVYHIYIGNINPSDSISEYSKHWLKTINEDLIKKNNMQIILDD